MGQRPAARPSQGFAYANTPAVASGLTHRSGCWTASKRDKVLAKGQARPIWANVRDQTSLGGGNRTGGPSIDYNRTGQEEHVLSHHGGLPSGILQADVTRAMPSFTCLNAGGVPAFTRSGLVGPICGATSMTSGHHQVRDRREALDDGSIYDIERDKSTAKAAEPVCARQS